MFGFSKLAGTRPKSIALETRAGNAIENSQLGQPDTSTVVQFDALAKSHHWKRRKAVCGIYNCFGMVWAARRTAIFEQDAIQTIRADDGYRTIPEVQIEPGDLVIYRWRTNREIWHVGVVASIATIIGGAGTPIPNVLSKLGVGGEVVHARDDIPFSAESTFEYWTDR